MGTCEFINRYWPLLQMHVFTSVYYIHGHWFLKDGDFLAHDYHKRHAKMSILGRKIAMHGLMHSKHLLGRLWEVSNLRSVIKCSYLYYKFIKEPIDSRYRRGDMRWSCCFVLTGNLLTTKIARIQRWHLSVHHSLLNNLSNYTRAALHDKAHDKAHDNQTGHGTSSMKSFQALDVQPMVCGIALRNHRMTAYVVKYGSNKGC